ncbi:hypothetical protein MCC93_15070 [Morococcus cerebrosus]|jgi:hypothetical protein|uniref:Uncharacterized protein n=1 Tax=Morococcus cerebrosus TaxID=1056807 RepID=A0A0C1GL40_9NEIS|nr:hypothetical protein MCC93_15070 [Morococcus cerebrosus]
MPSENQAAFYFTVKWVKTEGVLYGFDFNLLSGIKEFLK